MTVTEEQLHEARTRPRRDTLRLAACAYFGGALARSGSAPAVDFTRGKRSYDVRVVKRQAPGRPTYVSVSQRAIRDVTHFILIVTDGHHAERAYVVAASEITACGVVLAPDALESFRVVIGACMQQYRDQELEQYLSSV